MKRCDIVMEGGGVKGIALAGALRELERAGYQACRVAGTSAGAIAGALYASGMTAANMRVLLDSIDYTAFRDEGFVDRLGPPGQAASLIFEKGIYEGNYLREWLATELEKLGVRTFADLAIKEDWCKKLPPEQRYKLVVITADISRGRLVRLPWDYKAYGLDPDKQLVADAVRASMSIPFFYEPARLGESFLVDGATLSNFPIALFDNVTEWPTFGIKLSAKPDANMIANPVSNTYEFSRALLDTVLNAHDMMHLDDPCTIKRTIFIDSGKVKTTDFDIKPVEQIQLYDNGVAAGEKFFKAWDFEKYKKVCPIKTS